MQRADLVLLDDVLSGLDEHTKTRVSSRVFGPQGLLKQDGTAFLVVVTDNRLLPLFDHCVSLTAQGTIARQGPANTLESEMISQQHREEQASDSKTASHAVEEQSDGDASGGRRDSILDEPPQSSRRAGDLALYGLYATAAGRVNTTVYLAFVAALAVLYNFSCKVSLQTSKRRQKYAHLSTLSRLAQLVVQCKCQWSVRQRLIGCAFVCICRNRNSNPSFYGLGKLVSVYSEPPG